MRTRWQWFRGRALFEATAGRHGHPLSYGDWMYYRRLFARCPFAGIKAQMDAHGIEYTDHHAAS